MMPRVSGRPLRRIILTMPRRHDDTDGWTYEDTPGVGRFRWRVLPERVDSLARDGSYVLSDDNRSLLAEEARDRGMTLPQYYGWVGRMPTSELHVYRDRIMAGSAGERLNRLYWAWLKVRNDVQLVQMLIGGRWG